MWLAELEAVENRSKQPVFQPKLSDETDTKERQAVLDHLDKLARLTKHNRSARILRVWHGCAFVRACFSTLTECNALLC